MSSSMGASAALPVWNALVSKLTRYLSAPEPTPPQGVVRLEIDPQSGLLASEGCPEVVGEWFLEGTEPTETCAHSTLFEWEGEEVPSDVDPPTP